jgi:hypothetical protein
MIRRNFKVGKKISAKTCTNSTITNGATEHPRGLCDATTKDNREDCLAAVVYALVALTDSLAKSCFFG